jgi:glycerol-3-phosphate acyltransferase
MSKAFSKSLSQLNKALIRRLNALVVTRAQPAPARPSSDGGRVAPPPPPLDLVDALPSSSAAAGGVAVCKVEGGLLRSSSAFPYFMLVALEGGGLVRAMLLLLLYPALRLLGHDRAVRAMAVVTFLGVRKDAFRASRAALPKLLLEDVSAEVFDVAVAPPRRRCVCVSAMPRAMVQPFLAEYLGVDAVVAPEMREFRGYYLSIMEDEREVLRALDVGKVFAGDKAGGGSDDDVVVGVAGLGSSFAQVFQKHCKVCTSQLIPKKNRRCPINSAVTTYCIHLLKSQNLLLLKEHVRAWSKKKNRESKFDCINMHQIMAV